MMRGVRGIILWVDTWKPDGSRSLRSPANIPNIYMRSHRCTEKRNSKGGGGGSGKPIKRDDC